MGSSHDQFLVPKTSASFLPFIRNVKGLNPKVDSFCSSRVAPPQNAEHPLAPFGTEVFVPIPTLASIALSIQGWNQDTSPSTSALLCDGMSCRGLAKVLRSSNCGDAFIGWDFCCVQDASLQICRGIMKGRQEISVVPGMGNTCFKQALLLLSDYSSTAAELWRWLHPYRILKYVLRKRHSSYPVAMWVIDHGKIHAQRISTNFPKSRSSDIAFNCIFGHLKSADQQIPYVGSFRSVARPNPFIFRKSPFFVPTRVGNWNGPSPAKGVRNPAWASRKKP